MIVRMDLSGIAAIDAQLTYLHRRKVVVFIRDRKPQGSSISAAQYAIHNEYGTIHIPARPFWRTATEFGDAVSIIESHCMREVQKVIDGTSSGEAALHSMGKFVVLRIKETMRSGNWVSNAPSTIKKKRRNEPLFDTATLYNAITYKIELR